MWQRRLRPTPNTGQNKFVGWITSLPATGTDAYTYTKGGANTFTACAPYIAALGSCFGNNSATPYVLTQPPVTQPTNYLPAYAQVLPFQTTLADGSNTVTDELWQIANDQAIVTIITLPPVGAYFGFQTYLLERPATAYPPSPTIPYYPPGPTCTAGTGFPNLITGPHSESKDCNYVVFGYFNNPINNALILQTNGLEWNTYTTNPPTPTTFGTIAIITTANMTLASHLTSAFAADGYNSNLIFVEPMPAAASSGSPTLNVGVGLSSDTYISVVRYTLSKYGSTGGSVWNSGNNIITYRVEQPSSAPPPPVTNTGMIYDSATVTAGLTMASCNTNETLVAPTHAPCPVPGVSVDLNADLVSIAQTLVTWANSSTGHVYAYHLASSGGVPGPGCITNGTSCAGGTQDNDSYRTFRMVGALTNPYPIFVVGVNHAASTTDFTTPTPVNNALYTGISIADITGNVGVADAAQANAHAAGFTSPVMLTGSAYAVLQGLTPPGSSTPIYGSISSGAMADINNLYIHAFYRKPIPPAVDTCTSYICQTNNIYTTDITDDQTGVPSYPNNIPTTDAIQLTERGYLLPVSTTTVVQPLTALTTGAAAALLQSPYIVCDTAQPTCAPN